MLMWGWLALQDAAARAIDSVERVQTFQQPRGLYTMVCLLYDLAKHLHVEWTSDYQLPAPNLCWHAILPFIVFCKIE